MSLFENFLEGTASKLAGFKGTKKVKAGIDLAFNATPWIVGGACVLGGVYGLETYLAVDLAKGVRDNLKKAKEISDPVKDWYTIIGDELVDEKAYEKNHNKELGKISDTNSLLSLWKSIYDK